MSAPEPAHRAEVRPDPWRPNKALGAAVVAGLGVALAQGQDLLPPWALLVLAVVSAFVTTYYLRNPPEPPS